MRERTIRGGPFLRSTGTSEVIVDFWMLAGRADPALVPGAAAALSAPSWRRAWPRLGAADVRRRDPGAARARGHRRSRPSPTRCSCRTGASSTPPPSPWCSWCESPAARPRSAGRRAGRRRRVQPRRRRRRSWWSRSPADDADRACSGPPTSPSTRWSRARATSRTARRRPTGRASRRCRWPTPTVAGAVGRPAPRPDRWPRRPPCSATALVVLAIDQALRRRPERRLSAGVEREVGRWAGGIAG